MPRSGKAVELLRAAARGLGLSLGDHTIALERREVLSHGLVCNAEPFRQIFDGKALLVNDSCNMSWTDANRISSKYSGPYTSEHLTLARGNEAIPEPTPRDSCSGPSPSTLCRFLALAFYL